ncbi:helix-turn-helix domain-containing protein [Kitasatospora sp. MY 5-36]|uniref:helix-turn-helix domain-containing protein n=1 Tax=Kitasatospora sp. MY 5-36 TaxID=1678027 RepID=UPI0006709440|nr:helix-turn-helix transcriptional regulator [Kitasatospora sp. MY 5-36]
MAARPNILHPERSPEEWLGNEIRQWRMLRGYGQDELGTLVHLSGDLIGKMERGERRCLPHHAEALDIALDTGGALARSLVLVNMQVGLRGEDDSAVATAQAAHPSAASVDSLSPIAVPLIQPGSGPGSSVLPGDIAHVESAAAVLRSWDNLHGGGGLVRETAVAQLRWVRGLTEAPCSSPLRPKLLTAASRLASAAGAVLLDTGEFAEAGRHLRWATELAEEASDWSARAVSFNLRSRLATWCEQYEDSVTLAELGLVRSDRLSPAERAMLNNAAARGHARLGNRQAALAAIGRSDEAYGQVRATQESPWMSYYDDAQHHGDTGHAVYDLALTGHAVDDALDRLRNAVDGHSQSFARSRTFSRTKLTGLLLVVGDPDDVLPETELAMAEVARLRSHRAVRDLQELASIARRYERHSGLQGLHLQIAATVGG